MAITKDGNGVIIEGPFTGFDQFKRSGTVKDTVFAVVNDKSPLKQFKFDASEFAAEGTITLKAANGTGQIVLTLPSSSGTIALSGSSGNAFTIMQTPAGTFPTATGPSDTLDFRSDGHINITGDANTDSITFSLDNSNVDFTNHQLKNNSAASVVQWQTTAGTRLFEIGTTSSTKTNLRLQMGSGQEDDPFQIYNSGASKLSYIDSTGKAVFTSVTSPTFSGNLSGNPFDPSNAIPWVEDFHFGQGVMWNTNNSGAGAGTSVISAATESAARGVISFNTGTTTTGRATWYQQFYTIGNGPIRIGWRVKLPTLSDGTDTYYIRLGYGADWYPSDEVNGLLISYSSAANSGNLQFISKNASTTTTVNTSSTLSAATWTYLEMEINSAGTSAQFYINGGASGSPITTNLPVNKNMYLYTAIVKTAGTTSRSLYVDFIKYYETPASAR